MAVLLDWLLPGWPGPAAVSVTTGHEARAIGVHLPRPPQDTARRHAEAGVGRSMTGITLLSVTMSGAWVKGDGEGRGRGEHILVIQPRN